MIDHLRKIYRLVTFLTFFDKFCHKALHPESGLPDIVPGAFSFTLKPYFEGIPCVALLYYLVIEGLHNRWCYKPTFQRGWGSYTLRSQFIFQLFISLSVMEMSRQGSSPHAFLVLGTLFSVCLIFTFPIENHLYFVIRSLFFLFQAGCKPWLNTFGFT